MSKLPLRVATGTPSRIETADGWHFGIEWKDTASANPYGEAEAFAAFIVRAVNSHDALVSALQIIASRADGYTHGDKRVEMAFSGIAELALVALAAEKEEAA